MRTVMGTVSSRSACVAAFAGLVLSASPALASVLTSVSTSGQISGVCGPAFPFLVDSHPSGLRSQVNLVDGIVNLTNPPVDCKAGAGISGFASSEINSLRVRVESNSSTGATAAATASFRDTFVLTNIVNGVGPAPLSFTVGAAGFGEVATDAPDPDFDLAGGHWGVRVIANGVTLIDSLTEVFSGSFGVVGTPGPVPGPGTFNIIVNFVYGQPLDIEVMIEVLATTNASDAEATVTHSRLDFSNTVRISSITLPPGAELQTASGTLYPLTGASSNVPEPGTALLLAAGFAGLVGFARIRRPPRPDPLAR